MPDKGRILLAGPPGVGKTTLVKKVAQALTQKGMTVQGFYTEEVRDANGTRKGFDVASLTNATSRKPLARSDLSPALQNGPKVGKYSVLVQEFESVALPCLVNPTSQVLIIDEIGKMEMFSKKFVQCIRDIYARKGDLIIISTIPNRINGGPLALLLSELKKSNEIIEVSKSNRNELLETIVSRIEM